MIDAIVKGGERELEGADPGGVTLGSERWRMNGEADSPTDLEMTAPKNQGEKVETPGRVNWAAPENFAEQDSSHSLF